MGSSHRFAVLLNPFSPFSTAKVLALKATVLLLLTLLIKARVQIVAGSALGILLLLLQTLVFLAISVALQRPEAEPWPLKWPWRCCSGTAAACCLGLFARHLDPGEMPEHALLERRSS